MNDLEERFEIRRKIHLAGDKLCCSIKDEDLRYLVGEIMALNVDYVILHRETVGAEIILARGFTSNQETWIKNIDKKLREAVADE